MSYKATCSVAVHRQAKMNEHKFLINVHHSIEWFPGNGYGDCILYLSVL